MCRRICTPAEMKPTALNYVSFRRHWQKDKIAVSRVNRYPKY